VTPRPPRIPGTVLRPGAHETAAQSSSTAQSGGNGYIAELLRLMGVSPGTAQHVQDLLLPVLTIVVMLAVAAVLARFGGRMIRRAMIAWARARAAIRGEEGRPAPRVDTVSRIVANTWRVVVWVTVVLLVLGKLGINLSPFLFGATVVGMTIGFGAQTVVRDFLAGFLLLLEDQYRIGDTITVVGTTGVVDEVSLRVTRLRGSDGTVWYVPNGDIRELANLSRQWHKTSIDILLPPDVDLSAATTAMEDEARRAYADETFGSRLLEPPALLGVKDQADTGITTELVVKTAPLQGDGVARELRARVLRRLGEEGHLGGAGASAAGDR
jgi:small-conductance mechanosensitive channel